MIVAGGALGTPELLQRSGLGGAPGRPQPPHPPRLLGRRPLRGGGARLGRGDAELLRRRVGARSGILLEATFTPLAFGGAWLLGAGARATSGAMLDFGHVGSIGVHLCDHSSGRVGLGAEGSLRASYKLTARRRRPPRLRHRPRRRSPLRRRRHRGLPEHRPGRGAEAGRPGRASRRPASSPRSCASRPSTRWAPRGSPPTRARAPAASTAPSTAPRDLYVADGSLFPTSVGVNPMMTIIAFAKQVARGVAGRAGWGLRLTFSRSVRARPPAARPKKCKTLHPHPAPATKRSRHSRLGSEQRRCRWPLATGGGGGGGGAWPPGGGGAEVVPGRCSAAGVARARAPAGAGCRRRRAGRRCRRSSRPLPACRGSRRRRSPAAAIRPRKMPNSSVASTETPPKRAEARRVDDPDRGSAGSRARRAPRRRRSSRPAARTRSR